MLQGAEAGSVKFATAGKLLAAGGSENAATALTCIRRAHVLNPEAEEEVRVAQRAVRDILVVRLCAQVPPNNREAFLKAAEEAFAYPEDREAKNLLLLSYSKIFKHMPDCFLSNNALAAAGRGRPRPRRNRTGKRAKSMPPYEEGRLPAWVQIPEWALGWIGESSSFAPRMVSIGRRETTMDGFADEP